MPHSNRRATADLARRGAGHSPSDESSADVTSAAALDARDLLHRSSTGDAAAFRELYQRSSPGIYGLALQVLQSPELAAEVTQQAYVDVWRHAADYRPARGSVFSWMVGIAHQRAVDRLRCLAAGTMEHRHTTPGGEVVPDGSRVGDEKVLPPPTTLAAQRDVLTLAYFEGHTQKQVAMLLDLPLATVTSRIRDGLIGLRAALAQPGATAGGDQPS